jgi:hypothetical protein
LGGVDCGWGRFLFDEGIEELFEITARDGVAFDAITGGPLAGGEVVGAEKAIEEGEVDGEVDVDGFFFDTVVPVVESGHGEEFAETIEFPSHIRVQQSGVDVHDQDVHADGHFGEAEDHHGDDGGAAEDEDLDEVHSGGGHPVHGFGGVMDGVEAPQKWDAVEEAVNPVLHEIGEEHELEQLEDEGLRGDGVAEGCPGGVGGERECGGHGEEREDLDEEAADEVVEEIFTPFFAEKVLVGVVSKEAFDGDEEEAGENHIQHEPVQAEENAAGGGALGVSGGAAEDGGEQDEGDGGEAEDFIGAEDETQDAQREAGDEDAVDDEAIGNQDIECVGLGDGKERGEAEAEDEKETGECAEESGDAAEPAGADAAIFWRGFEIGAEVLADFVDQHSCLPGIPFVVPWCAKPQAVFMPLPVRGILLPPAGRSGRRIR